MTTRRARSSRPVWRCGLIAAALALLAACAPENRAPTPRFTPAAIPEKLSDWGVLRVHDGILELSAGVVPYDIATPLFSDYALKLRTIALPPGTTATFDAEREFELPVGTILTKTFFYPAAGANVTYGPEPTLIEGRMSLAGYRLIETRVLAKTAEGWTALPYVWSADGSDAVLKRTGDLIETALLRPDGRREALDYFVPNANQCAACHATDHATRAIQPIGIRARHLNKASTFAPGMNQLDHWRLAGLIVGDFSGAASAPRNVDWTDASAPLDDRARAYLDANCAHCHSDIGPAKTSGLDLRSTTPMGPKYGWCKSVIAAGSGTGGRRFDIVPGKPDESILAFRLETTDPAAMMPELGRSVVHEEGVALIREWIAGMSGQC